MKEKQDSGNRRLSNDRRKFTYTAYSPERRSGIDRREMHLQNLKMKVA